MCGGQKYSYLNITQACNKALNSNSAEFGVKEGLTLLILQKKPLPSRGRRRARIFPFQCSVVVSSTIFGSDLFCSLPSYQHVQF